MVHCPACGSVECLCGRNSLPTVSESGEQTPGQGGIPITPPPDFPVEWDDDEEPTLLWSWDNFHSPLPRSPLGDSLGKVTGVGSEAAARELGRDVPARRQKRINGFGYNAVAGGAGPGEAGPANPVKLLEALRTTREKWDSEWEPELERDIAEMKSVDLEALSDEGLLEAIDGFFEKQKRHWKIHFLVVYPASAALERLDRLYSELTGVEKGTEAHKLVDSSRTKTMEVNRALADLATRARELPGAATVLTSADDSAATPAALSESDDGRRWLEMLEDFLEWYGYRPTGFDVRFPTWKEDPSFVLLNVRGLLQDPDAGASPEKAQKIRAREREEALARANKALDSAPLESAQEKRAEFEEALKQAQELWPLKEDHAFYIDHASMAVVQHAVKEIGRRLVDRGILKEMDDFYFLDLEEARAALRDGEEFMDRVRERRADHERWSRMNPPRYLGTLPADGAPEGAAEAVAALEIERFQLLRGEGASAGTAVGPARIVRSPAEFGKVRPGDVLICRSTAATWTPLFDIVSGLVSEAGGILSHPAVVAREYGLPAVVGVHRATELVSDGEPVRIDGAAGTVQLA